MVAEWSLEPRSVKDSRRGSDQSPRLPPEGHVRLLRAIELGKFDAVGGRTSPRAT